MEGFPQHVSMRDGSPVTLRGFEPRDGEALLEFYRALPEADRLVMRDDVTRPEWLDRFNQNIASGESTSLLAEAGGAIVGEATLYRPRYGWTAHVSEIRVNVAASHRRHGVGAALARALVQVATSQGADKIVAMVPDNQPQACATFAKLGFVHEATLKGHVRDIHGFKHDLMVFANDVSHIWAAMEALTADYSPTLGS